MTGAGYTCPSCGPIAWALHGDDEELHCGELGCDLVVTAELPPCLPSRTIFGTIGRGRTGAQLGRKARSDLRRSGVELEAKATYVLAACALHGRRGKLDLGPRPISRRRGKGAICSPRQVAAVDSRKQKTVSSSGREAVLVVYQAGQRRKEAL